MNNTETIIKYLKLYNEWRRGDEKMEQPNPTEIGKLIDEACEMLTSLERERDDLQKAVNGLCKHLGVSPANTTDITTMTRNHYERILRELAEAREALRKSIRFVEAYEPHSRGAEADQNETLSIIRKELEETK